MGECSHDIIDMAATDEGECVACMKAELARLRSDYSTLRMQADSLMAAYQEHVSRIAALEEANLVMWNSIAEAATALGDYEGSLADAITRLRTLEAKP